MRVVRFCVLGLAAMLAMVTTAARAEACQHEKPTFVLVHGAFHGGWAWQRVAERLRARQYRVYTPTLTGLGEREHLATPDVSLETHIQDVVNAIMYEDLHDVILVGHSYGGIVITGVASRIPDRIAKLVYFDAVVPEPGQSFFDAIAFNEPLPPDLWLFPSFPPEAFGLTEPADIAYVGSHLTAQTLATFRDPLVFDWAALAGIEKSYVHCLLPWFSYEPFLAFRAKALSEGWDYYEVDSAHEAMITNVRDTVAILATIAR